MPFVGHIVHLARAMHFECLHHRLGPDLWIVLPRGILDAVDGRPCEKDHIFRYLSGLDIAKIQDDIALVESTRANDHRRIDAVDWLRQGPFRGMPFGAIGTQERLTTLERRCLAKIDAVQSRKQIDHIAPDAARTRSDPPVLAVYRRDLGSILSKFSNRAHGTCREGFAEHETRRARVERAFGCMDDFVWCPCDVGREE